jgi:hypothetical protein
MRYLSVARLLPVVMRLPPVTSPSPRHDGARQGAVASADATAILHLDCSVVLSRRVFRASIYSYNHSIAHGPAGRLRHDAQSVASGVERLLMPPVP